MRVDAHQHYWHHDAARDSWITENMATLRRDFLPEHAEPLLREANIDAVVAVQADQSSAETELLLSLAAQHDCIRGVVGWVDLRAPDLGEQLDRLRAHHVLKGFRHIAQSEPDDFLMQRDVVQGVGLLGERGYTYDILIYPRQLVAAERLVAQCPGVHFVLDHCAKPPLASGDLTEWRRGFSRLAQHDNVVCKLSGLVTEASWGAWTDEQLVPCLDAALDCFGAERLMFGSDWPVCLLSASYADVLSVVERWADRVSAGERTQIFGGTAAATYRLV